jgi:peptide/nickel transport system permease protein
MATVKRGTKLLRDITHNRLSCAGLIIILIFTGMAVFAPQLVGPYQSQLTLYPANLAPSPQHLLGTDERGQDVLNVLVYGSRISLLVGYVASFVSMVLGTAIGLICGYYGKAIDQVLSRLTDFFLVIPWLPFVLVIVSILKPSLVTIVVAIAFVSWPETTRVIRSQVLSIKERQFIERARAIGAGKGHILVNHILPNVMPLVWAEAVLTVSASIFTEAFLSFFGLGPQTGVETWGQMVDLAYIHLAILTGRWWYFAPPGVCITLLVLGFAMLGYGVEEIMNPALKRRGGEA